MDKDLLFLQPVICGLWQIVSMEKRGELDEESAVEAMNTYASKRFRVRRFFSKFYFQKKVLLKRFINDLTNSKTGMGYGRSLWQCRVDCG